MFNPRFFMCDRGGTNHKAIRIVYGDEFAKRRVVGCQCYFKNDASRIAKCIGPDMQEIIITLTKELCKVTTVAKYKILKSRQDEVAKLYPEIVNWINWWHERRSHIFAPFRGGGLPGVNLSKQGNAGWKRWPMSLVRPAKEEFATMVLQERQMHMFNNNLQASDGHGPSQADREAKFRAQQEREAEEFVNILDDEYVIMLEAVQSENPEYHLPKAAEKHRPKQKQKDDASKESKQNKNDNATTSPAPEQPAIQPEASSLKQKLAMASDVISGHLNPQNAQNNQVPNNVKDYSPCNPPVVILTDGTNISMCKGCGKKIAKEQRKYPNNMVFRKKGKTGYLFQGRHISKFGNIHFHLRKECLRHHDDTVQLRENMMHEEVFEDLSIEQMSVLNQKGFLKYITANFEVFN